MTKRITIQFEVDSAEFEDTVDVEYRRIFNKIANRIADYVEDGPIMDVNGNSIGEWWIRDEADN